MRRLTGPPRPLLGLGALLLLAPAPAHSQQRSVTLAEAIRLAELVDPAVVQARGQVSTTDAGIRAAIGGYLPSVNGGANYGKSFSGGPSRTDPITGEILSGDISSTSVSFTAGAQVTVFDGFRREAQVRSSRAQNREADAGLDYQRSLVTLRTTTTFLGALQSGELVRVARESIRRAEDQFRIAVARLSTRAATVADSLQTAANLG